MAKAVTLRQFSKKNVNYDVEFYANALPRKFPGYIIRNSLRLATVGWYQRHCVRQLSSKMRQRLQHVYLHIRRSYSLDS